MNASMTIALAIETLLMRALSGDDRFPMVRFTFAHNAKNAAQTLNRELDRNEVRKAIVRQGKVIAERSFGDDELTSVLGHVAWSPSVAKSAKSDEWIMTLGIAGIFATHGTKCQGIARYSKQGFGHPRVYWHGADGIRTTTLPEAL